MEINRKRALNLITNSDNIFGVTFIKKDKSTRRMGCRKGVDYTNGKGMAYKAKEYGLITVFDMVEARKISRSIKIANEERARDHGKQIPEKEVRSLMAKAYRNVNLNTLMELRINKQVYSIEPHAQIK